MQGKVVLGREMRGGLGRHKKRSASQSCGEIVSNGRRLLTNDEQGIGFAKKGKNSGLSFL